MSPEDAVDELGVPLWYRLAQALCPTSDVPVNDTCQQQAKHLVRRMERFGVVLAPAYPRSGDSNADPS